MGLLNCLEPHHRLAAPDTPPELVSPTSSSYSSRPSPFADQTWNSVTPISPPMSSYDHKSSVDMSSAGKSMEDGQKRNDAPQAAARTQLPPISSLLGTSTIRRQGHSPALSDHRPPFPPASALDRPPVASAHADRPHPAPYYAQTSSPPITQPRSTYEPKYEDRPSYHPLARSHSGHGSPRSDHFRHEPRSDGGSGSKWSAAHEYSLGGRDVPPLPSPQDRPPMPYPGTTREQPVFHRDPRPLPGPGPGPNPPPTPTSTVSEGVPAKDGLGPKIWTGTHFLPRFVRAAEVPGEGMCFFYDDGSHCKSVIDGEAVNPHWGVTKAGKPRKRLAIACVTCREKKIKCDPDFPRCSQCEKFGRICKFKNAPRGGHNTSPSTPPAEPDDHRRVAPLKPNEMHRPGGGSSASVSPRTTVRMTSPEPHHSKRVRVGYESYSPVHGEPPPLAHAPEASQSSRAWPQQPIELPRIHEDALNYAWHHNDPYVNSDPETYNSVMSTITSFFVNIDSTVVLRFLPEKAFKSWVVSDAHTKSPEDKMLGYSILALGMALRRSRSRELRQGAWEYSLVAKFAQSRSKPSLQLVQTRILLAVYYLSIGRACEANELSGTACAAALWLQLNRELHQSKDAALAVFPNNMNRAGYAESRRRTFWSCFLLERLMGLYPNRPAMLNVHDIFIRLPASDQSFEEQTDAQMPQYVPHVSILSQGSHQAAGVPAHLVQVVEIWADTMASICRSTYRPPITDSDFVNGLDRIRTRLDEWKQRLPESLTFSDDNMESADMDGNLGSLISMHLLYHCTMIKVHRHIHPAHLLPPAAKLQHLVRIRDHAARILEMSTNLDSLFRAVRTSMTRPPPVLNLAVVEAMDVLSAEGTVSELPKLIESLATAKAMVEMTGAAWEEVRLHRMMMNHRCDKLLWIKERGAEATSPRTGCRVFTNKEEGETKQAGELCWQLSESVDNVFPKNMDLVYTNLTQVPALYG